MTVASPDEMRRHDALYEPFPAFADWPRLPEHLVAQWDELVERLSSLRQEVDEEAFAAIREEQLRAAAWDTGAIEGLYTTDRGFTISVATQAAHWEAEVRREKGGDALALFEAQLAAYRQALDVATEATPISEAWIRHLHEVATAAQEKYEVHTAAGKQVHDLPKGEYKHHPNHIEKPDGSVHAHAPVAATGAEMARLVKDMRGEDFASAHPIEQASYAHYALVRVHPFADGNGRVARALASVFTLREASLPLVVYADEKPAYVAALEAADGGDLGAFHREVFSAVVETGLVISDRMRLRGFPDVGSSVQAMEARARGVGGVMHEELDEIAYLVADRVEHALNAALSGTHLPEGVSGRVGKRRRSTSERSNVTGYREPVRDGGRSVWSELTSAAPADGHVRRSWIVLIAEREALTQLLVKEQNAHGRFDLGLALHGLVPHVTERTKLRLNAWADSVMRSLLSDLSAASAEGLRRRGYVPPDPPTDGPASSGG